MPLKNASDLVDQLRAEVLRLTEQNENLREVNKRLVDEIEQMQKSIDLVIARVKQEANKARSDVQ